jgi:acyl-CoA thioester hydrolase
VRAVVLASYCEYKQPMRYEDQAQITAKITHFSGYKMTVEYEIINSLSGVLCVSGYTRHGLLLSQMKPVRLEREFPQIYQILNNQCEPTE